MNAKHLIIAAGAALALTVALLPATASADGRGHYGPQHGYGHGWGGHGYGWGGHGYGYGYGKPGHGHYKPWKRGYHAYPPRVIVPAPVYAVPYPGFIPVPAYAPPPPAYFPPVGNDFTIIWRAGW
jgi:hypothetical protein